MRVPGLHGDVDVKVFYFYCAQFKVFYFYYTQCSLIKYILLDRKLFFTRFPQEHNPITKFDLQEKEFLD